MFTDNKDFYPTPEALFYKLTANQRHFHGRILEPSAGAGDMIRYIKAKAGRSNHTIDAIENDGRLVNQLYADGVNVVWDDFLTYETFKEYDYIVMNPPFSNGVDHALKALSLAEAQLSPCDVFIILNKQTLDNAYSNKRQELLRILDAHKAQIEYVEEAFVDADRKTDVEVALIHVRVMPEDNSGSVYERVVGGMGGMTDVEASDELTTALSTFVQANELQAKMDDISRLVAEYEMACEHVKDAYAAVASKERFISYIDNANKTLEDERERKRAEANGEEYKRSYGGGKFSSVTSVRYTADDMAQELERLRRGYWELILRTDDFREHLTGESRGKLARQIETATGLEINLANIRMLLLAIQSNHTEMLAESVVNMFEKLTKYHMNQYSTNIHYYNGWKTNDAYKINRKIIVPLTHAFDQWDFGEDYTRIKWDVREYIDDIVKAFQLIDPSVSNEFTTISDKEFENDLLRFRMFLNGNIHVWFKNTALLDKLNYFCGQHFAWIPSSDEVKSSKEAREFVVREFGQIYEVTLLQA